MDAFAAVCGACVGLSGINAVIGGALGQYGWGRAVASGRAPVRADGAVEAAGEAAGAGSVGPRPAVGADGAPAVGRGRAGRDRSREVEPGVIVSADGDRFEPSPQTRAAMDADRARATAGGDVRGPSGRPLSEDEQKVLRELRKRHDEVVAHENAHLAAAGALAKGGAKYQYQTGPDGRQYAIGGSVQIDTSPGGTPEETITKAAQIVRAAMAPAEPSGQDRAVAAAAQQMAVQARAELAAKRNAERQGRGGQSASRSGEQTATGGGSAGGGVAGGSVAVRGYVPENQPNGGAGGRLNITA